MGTAPKTIEEIMTTQGYWDAFIASIYNYTIFSLFYHNYPYYESYESYESYEFQKFSDQEI